MFNTLSRAETLFRNSGPFFHLHTEPIENDLLVQKDSDYIVINNLLAMSSMLTGSKILAFAIMSNHIHLILEGRLEGCMFFFEDFKIRFMNYRSRHGGSSSIKNMKPGFTAINNLKQLRDEIAYVIRNPFVIREDVNPLAYRWCSGFLYFNPMLDTGGTPLADLPVKQRREILFSRKDVQVNGSLLVNGTLINPCSFVDYHRAMDFFDNARQFVMWVFKNIEGQVEVSRRLGEIPRLNDEEILSLSFKLCRTLFSTNSMKDLSFTQKKQLALKLKNEYSASNGQIARCVNMSLSDVNTMFPLAAKPQKQ